MSVDIAKSPELKRAIDAVLATQRLKDLEKLLPKTGKEWLRLFGVAVVGGAAALGGVGVANQDAGANFKAWGEAFLGEIPSNHITDISTVVVQGIDCVDFKTNYGVGERTNGELVVLDEQGKVVGPLGDGVCQDGVIVKVVRHMLKPEVLDHAWFYSAEDGNKRWSGSVKHGFTDK